MKSVEETLKERGITPETKFHNYNYLYKTVVEIIQERDKQIATYCNEKISSPNVNGFSKSAFLEIKQMLRNDINSAL